MQHKRVQIVHMKQITLDEIPNIRTTYTMEYSSAEMICVLKVNTECTGCKEKVMKVLKKIHGVYNITMDGDEGTVKVSGRVNPNTLLSILEKSGKHAKVKYVKFEGEVVERNPNYYGEYEYFPYDYGMEYYSYPPSLPFSQPQVYHPSYDFFQPPLFPPPPVPNPNPPPHPSAPFWAQPQHQQPPVAPMYGYGPPPPPTSFCPPQHQPPPPPQPPMNGYGPPPSTSFGPPQHQPPPPPQPPMNGYGPPPSASFGPPQNLPTEEILSKQKKSRKSCVIM